MTEVSDSPGKKSETESAKNNKPRRKSTMPAEPDYTKKLSLSKLGKQMTSLGGSHQGLTPSAFGMKSWGKDKASVLVGQASKMGFASRTSTMRGNQASRMDGISRMGSG